MATRLHLLTKRSPSSELCVSLEPCGVEVSVTQAVLAKRQGLLECFEQEEQHSWQTALWCDLYGTPVVSTTHREVNEGVEQTVIAPHVREITRATLQGFDFQVIVWPLLRQIGDPSALSSKSPTYLLHQGHIEGLERFSVRGALRYAVQEGKVPEVWVEAITPVPVWSHEIFEQMVGHSAPFPIVRVRELVVVVNPPSSEFIAAEVECLQRAKRQLPLDEILTQRVAMLQRAVRAFAEPYKIKVQFPCSSRDVLGAIQCSDIRSIVLVAHQDRRGIHFTDGVLPPGEIAHALYAREGSDSPLQALWLGVCGADRKGNLAEEAQRAGVSQVVSFGRFAYYGSQLSDIIRLIAEVGSGVPGSLLELVDRSWLAAMRAARRSGGSN